MKILTTAVLSGVLFVSSGASAQAGIIDFIALTETNPGGYGEGAWNPLVLSVGGATVTITGHATDDTPSGDVTQFAYLDWGTAGLGVCKDVVNTGLVGTIDDGRTANNCNPSSDDNVTFNEYLKFVFDRNVVVNNLWFNNNHDGGFGTSPQDKVKIAGTSYNVATGYAGGINGIGPFNVSAGTEFKVAFKNEQFYISGMEVTAVPEPATALALVVGLLVLVAARQSSLN